MDANGTKKPEDTTALLSLLAIGNQQIEEAEHREIEEVFAELDEMDRQ
jgi:hypothetical protein